MRTYPLQLNLAGRPVLVVGGGTVGLRKVRSLLEAGAAVTLVSEHCPDALDSRVTWREGPYVATQLEGMQLVFACTDDRSVNARIATDARTAGIWVNAADQPEDCDVILPAVFTEGPLCIAVSTSGQAPALSALLRNAISDSLPEGIGELCELVGELRHLLKSAGHVDHLRHAILRDLCNRHLLSIWRDSGPAGVRRRFETLCNQHLGSDETCG